MRVLFVDREGAASIWGLMAAIACRLESEGWQTGIATMQEPGRSGLPESVETLSLGVHRVPVRAKRWGGDLLGQWRDFDHGFHTLLKRLRPDVVHVNFAVPGIWARLAAYRLGIPWVVSTQHELRGSLALHLRLGLWATRRWVDVHTYVSESVAASFGIGAQTSSLSGDTLPAHVVIRNGVDEEVIKTAVREVGTRVPGRIVAPGRLVPEKGYRQILEAFAQLREQHPDTELLIAGSGPEESSLQRLAERLDIAGCVEFMGWLPRDDLWRLVASAQVAVFASDGTQEGFGLALAEAALLGTPLVVSDIAAFREVLADNDRAAWWFRPGDTDALVDAMRYVFSVSPEERGQREALAIQAVKARAMLGSMVEQYARLYDWLALRCN